MILRVTVVTVLILALLALFPLAGCSLIGRKMLFFPSHREGNNGLAPWVANGEIVGFTRKAGAPRNVWLLLHGNAGQASDRAYALPCFSSGDSVFILEYPGYGPRRGTPSREAFNQAAKDAYLLLRTTYPQIPICVAGESIGTGPACFLATQPQPPDKLVLIVPFDQLASVARDHFPSFLVSLVLKDNWDNVEALSHYKGPVDIFGAREDTVIPVSHAKALAAAVSSSKLVIVEGGHNEWSYQKRVEIRNP